MKLIIKDQLTKVSFFVETNDSNLNSKYKNGVDAQLAANKREHYMWWNLFMPKPQI